MESLISFVKQFIGEIIITVLFSTSFLTLYFGKLRYALEESMLGIRRIHRLGKNVKSMQQAIKKAKRIMHISFLGHGFIFDYRTLLEDRIAEGCIMQFMFAKKESTLLREMSIMENDAPDSISSKFEPTLDMLKSIIGRANPESVSSIEVRTFDSEIRNPITICYDADNEATAFLTVSMPPKRSIDCIMIEFKPKQCDDAINHFKMIWERHTNDIVYKIVKPIL